MRTWAVAVVHPEAMVAEGISAALARYPSIVPVGFGTTGLDAERLGERADAMAVDGRLAETPKLASHLRARGVRVVFIGGHDEDDEGIRVPTAASIGALAQALVPALADRPHKASPLTKREQEILELVASGLAGKQVARQLGISAKTVEQHKTHIFAKLGVPNQTAAVSVVLSSGLGNGFGNGFGSERSNGSRNGNGNGAK
jgi:DNA-binding CsgD family transcriptional regulator